MSKASKRIAREKGGGVPEAARETASRSFLNYLIFTAILCGALVMVIEILGSRVIGPFFGASLFVWTSLITVTLVALAAGYAVGGILSDRKGSPFYLYSIILAAGVLSLLVPLLKGFVLKTTVSWGLRTGAFASSLALFGPALFLLGCVSPYIVRIAASELRNIGRTVGLFYAASTVGSVLGTVLTGFLLIAYFGVNAIFTVTGVLLITLASGYFLFFRGMPYVLVFLVLPLFLYQQEGPVTKVQQNGWTVTKLFSKDTFYGNLKVMDNSSGSWSHRDLMIDGMIQGGIDMKNGLSVYDYAYYLEFLPYGMNPAGKNCLVIGLGAGVVSMWYQARGIQTDVVDIDPHVVDIARQYFGFALSGNVVIADARYYLNTAEKRYDYIIYDAFNGDTTPGHLLSIEALRLVRERLADEGILAINVIGSLQKDNFMTASIIRTIEKVFKTVTIYPAIYPGDDEGKGNIIILAHNAAFKSFDQLAVAAFPVHPLAAERVRYTLGKTYTLPADVRTVILSDDYNPIDFYDIGVKEWIRTMIQKNSDPDLLI